MILLNPEAGVLEHNLVLLLLLVGGADDDDDDGSAHTQYHAANHRGKNTKPARSNPTARHSSGFNFDTLGSTRWRRLGAANSSSASAVQLPRT